MTEWNGHSELAELAHLPAAHPARAELETRISLMDPVGQERWRKILRETDLLYLQLPDVEVPAGLEARLMGLPAMRQNGRARLERFLVRPLATRWVALAACVLIAAGLATYIYWPRSLPAPPAVGMLDPAVAEKIAVLAVTHCQGQASLQISSSDAGKLQAALASQKLPVTVAVSPPRANFVLVGGGSCEFGTTRAAYTTWQAAGLTFTLFQFDGRALCVPSEFLVTTAAPAALGARALHYHVVIWPGRGPEGDWAMVLENDAALGAFMTRNCR
jgi:hypothetical protein